LICPKCKKSESQVVDSRDVDSRSIRRRRECLKCHFRFTTYERLEFTNLHVIKRDGKTEIFDRTKIIRGIGIAAKDRIGVELIEEIAEDIEIKIAQNPENSIQSRRIGNMVMSRLKKIDEISYLRFASVYKNFEDIESFEEELEKLKK